MILQALYEYYHRKRSIGEVAPLGFMNKEIDFAIVLDNKGNYVDIECMQIRQEKRFIGTSCYVPAIGKQVEKHDNSGNDANLLWDKAEFVLGIGKKGKAKNRAFVQAINNYYSSPPEDVLAILKFIENEKDKSRPFEKIIEHADYGEIIRAGWPIVTFKILGNQKLVIEQRHVVSATKEKTESEPMLGTCLVTGEQNIAIELTHTVTKGISGAQSSGANIVSFNKDSFNSYRKKQSQNAPIGKIAAEAYTKALQSLINSNKNKVRISDTTILFWAGRKPHEYNFESDFPWLISSPRDEPDRGINAVKGLYEAARSGKLPLEEGNRFYVLGLSPNSARISVRFWKMGTVREFGERIIRHFDDLEITKADYERAYCTLNELLASTSIETKDAMKPNAVYFRGKYYDVPPNLAGAVTESILDGTPYPATLLYQCIRRIRAEIARKDKNGKPSENVTRARAAILKAYLNRINGTKNENKKELFMALDPENTEVGYVLGRLFALLERIQEESAKPTRLNSTIRERYYGSFSSSPVAVMPLLLKLKNHHLAKLNGGLKHWFENRLGDVIDLLKPANIPTHLTLDQQALFAVGYYHQRNHKEEKKN